MGAGLKEDSVDRGSGTVLAPPIPTARKRARITLPRRRVNRPRSIPPRAIYSAIDRVSAEGVCAFDSAFTVVAWNSAMQRMFGPSAEAAIGRSVFDVFPNLNEAEHRKAFDSIVTGKARVTRDLQIVNQRTGERLWVEARCTPICNAKGAATGFVAVMRDITEQRWAEDSLWESQRAYATLTSVIPGMAYRCRNDETWTMEFVSEACRELTGYATDELLFNRIKAYVDIIHPDDREMVWNKVQEGLKGHTIFRAEYRLITASGAEKWVLEIGRGVYAPDGALLAVEGYVTDISELRANEATIAENAEMMRALLNAPEDIAVLTDTNGMVLAVSDTAAVHFQRMREQFIGTCLYDYLPPELAVYQRARIAEVLATGREVRFEDSRDGRSYDTSVYPVLDAKGNISRLAIFIRDITEARAAEQALREERDFSSAIVDTTQALVVVADPQGHILRFNRACEETTGYSFEEVWGRPIWEHLVPPAERDTICAWFAGIVRTQQPGTHEGHWRTKDGHDRLIAWSTTAIPDGQNQIKYVVCTGIDITERHQAEEALRRSERNFRSIIENTSDMIAVLSPEGRFEFVTPASQRHLGYTPAYLLGKMALEMIHPDDVEATRNILAQVINGRRAKPAPIQFRIRGSNGEWRTLETIGRQHFDENGNACLLASSRDVTERNRSLNRQRVAYRIAESSIESRSLEDLFKRIHSELNTVIEAANLYIALFDERRESLTFPYRVDVHTAPALRRPERRPSGFPGLTEYTIRQGRTLLFTRSQIVELASRGEIDLAVTGPMPEAWLGAPLRSGGTIIGLIAVQSYSDPNAYSVDDLSLFEFVSGQIGMAVERKVAEEAATKARDFYLTIFDAFPALIWRSCPDGRKDHFNSGWLRYTGRSAEKEVGEGWMESIHPDDLDDVRVAYATSLKAGEQFEIEYRLRRCDGEYRWFVDCGRPYQNIDGTFAGYIGACYDITYRKEHERHLDYLAMHDPLTDLQNRRSLEEAMQRAVSRARRGMPSALLFLDLDQFKVINDTYGHLAGDKVLVEVSQLLKKDLRTEDILVRLGGDEFAVLLDTVSLADATQVAERMRQRINSHVFTIAGNLVSIGVSIGIAYIDGQIDPWQAMAQADSAMYAAKDQGSNRVIIHCLEDNRSIRGSATR